MTGVQPRYFRYDSDGPITTITFNRPERRNGLDPAVMLELEQLVLRVRDDREVRALVVTGTGNSFCAGADLSLVRRAADAEERRRVQAEMDRVPRLIGRVFDVLAHLDVMTVAAVNGYAVGGGWSLALAFDHCLAVPEAEFWVPEVDIGVPFRGLPALTLTARLGPVLAKEAMILCRRFTAAELAALGVINRVVPLAELAGAARDVAAAFAAKPAKAAVGTKRDINAAVYGTRHF